MYPRRSAVVKYFIAALIGAVVYSEWFVYIVQPLYWNEIKCKEGADCVKILFIADPQIQGEMAVSPPLNYLFNWDSDRYLHMTFSMVLKHFKPEVIVYLGDLMDEGSISTIPQFHGYAKRLSSIFDIDYPVVQVWLPGDNDIGGENEPIRKDKVNEFEKIYNQPSIITYRNISFYKINAITHTIPLNIKELDNSTIRVAVSHYDLTSKYVFGKEVNDKIHPHIYFCAHKHESQYVKQNEELGQKETHRLSYGDNVLKLDLHEDSLYEIFVPTCSYRMGTSNIGYGVAVLENQHWLSYTVFWSSTRFPYLFFYAAVLVIITIYSLIYCIAKIPFRKPKYQILVEGPNNI